MPASADLFDPAVYLGEICDDHYHGDRTLDVHLLRPEGEEPRVSFIYRGYGEEVSFPLERLLDATGETIEAVSHTVGAKVDLCLGDRNISWLRTAVRYELEGAPGLEFGPRDRPSPLAD